MSRYRLCMRVFISTGGRLEDVEETGDWISDGLGDLLGTGGG